MRFEEGIQESHIDGTRNESGPHALMEWLAHQMITGVVFS